MRMMSKIPKKKLLPSDELNEFAEKLRQRTWVDENGRTRYRKDCSDIIDEMLDLFLLSYAMGSISANEDLDDETRMTTKDANNMVFTEIAGKTWDDRVREHYDNGDSVEDIIRVADSEMTRDFNGGVYDTAIASGIPCKKKWIAILDEKTRDSHFVLNGTVVGLNDRFNSISGDSALYPGGFASAEENCGCRCGIELIP